MTGPAILIAGLAIVALVVIFYVLANGRRRKDRPGPHNNWRKDTSTVDSSGWGENFPGQGVDGLPGGVD